MSPTVLSFYNALDKCKGDKCENYMNGACSYTKKMSHDICVKKIYDKFMFEREEKIKLKKILSSLESSLDILQHKIHTSSIKIESCIK